MNYTINLIVSSPRNMTKTDLEINIIIFLLHVRLCFRIKTFSKLKQIPNEVSGAIEETLDYANSSGNNTGNNLSRHEDTNISHILAITKNKGVSEHKTKILA